MEGERGEGSNVDTTTECEFGSCVLWPGVESLGVSTGRDRDPTSSMGDDEDLARDVSSGPDLEVRPDVNDATRGASSM